MASFPNFDILQSQTSDGKMDPFLGFVEHAQSNFSCEDGDSNGDQMPWGWVVSRILKTCVAYPSGVTAAILLSDLFQAWSEQRKYLTSKRKPEVMNLLKKSQRRSRLPNTVTIDSIYEKNFISITSVIEAVVLDTFLLPGTNICMLSLGDMWSSCTIDLYLHRRYYEHAGANGFLKKGREIFVTGCTLRTGTGTGGSRLLPTEYLVILLDEDQDEDAMLLGAQFCTHYFSSISLDDSTSYYFYARIEKKESLEPLGSIQRKQITLIDNEGAKMEFLLWGEQVKLANLFSVGSMLAIDRPFISNFLNNNNTEELCLEYGSATLIYLVPFVHQDEQLVLAATQVRSQELKSSQVSLPRNSHGSIDFTKYPFRAYIVDLGDKMAGISLYGIVTQISRERNNNNSSENVFCLGIEDETGVIIVKIHFTSTWSLGRVGVGHTVYISGLSCQKNSQRMLEVSWFEKEAGSSFFNISCLPALLNSSCLHNISLLSDISSHSETTLICCVSLDQVHNIRAILCHHLCGESVDQISHDLYKCTFCQCDFDYNKCNYSFQLQIEIKDESAKIFAWCVGQTASELLQISPDEFLSLPEDERAMYLYTLQDESFMVALVNCKRQHEKLMDQFANCANWEITRAQRSE